MLLLQQYNNKTCTDFEFGKQLFFSTYSKSEIGDFFGTLLAEQKYAQIADIISAATITQQADTTYLKYAYVAIADTNQNFNFFVQFALDYNLDITPLLFASFYALQNTELYLWQESIKLHLLKLCYDNYSAVLQAAIKFDPDLHSISVFLEADKIQTIKYLFFRYQKQECAKTIAILSKYPTETLQQVKSIYFAENEKARVNLIKLLLPNKHKTDVSNYLQGILLLESSKQIKTLLSNKPKIKKEKAKQNSFIFDSNGKTHFTIGNSTYYFTVNNKFAPVANQNTPSINIAQYTTMYKRLSQEILRQINMYLADMIKGTKYTYKQFTERLSDNTLFKKIAETLVFSQYSYDNNLMQLFTIHNALPIDLDNNNIQLPTDAFYSIIHPVLIPPKFSFLLQQDVYQPFNQLKRKTFTVQQDDISFGYVKRFYGKHVNTANFSNNLPKDYKFITNSLGKYVGAYVIINDVISLIEFSPCVLHISAFTTLYNIKFFAVENQILLNNNIAFEKMPCLDLSQIDKIVFSEALYNVDNAIE